MHFLSSFHENFQYFLKEIPNGLYISSKMAKNKRRIPILFGKIGEHCAFLVIFLKD